MKTLVAYFSAQGTTAAVAKELAAKLNSQCAQRLAYYGALADAVYGETTNTLNNTVKETGDKI